MNKRLNRKSRDARMLTTKFIIIIIMLLVININVPTKSEAATDYDECGLFRNYNTDNSIEQAVRFDYDDDTIQKVFYISEYELTHSDTVHLWIYGRCWGSKVESEYPTHEIKVITPSDENIVREFRCYKMFSYTEWQWQMFEFETSYLESDAWIKVQICDIDYYTYNNLEIGIDKTYGACPAYPGIPYEILDWDQSYWYSEGAGFDEAEENALQGELMIKMELGNMQTIKRVIPMEFDDDVYGYDSYDFIPIDLSDDTIRWRCDDITSDDIQYATYARLYIYGYSWIGGENPNPPQTQNQFVIKINGNEYYYDPDIYWAKSRPIGQWYYFDFPPEGILQTGENVFEIHDKSTTDYYRHNLAIIRFSDIDEDQSAWYYNPGGGSIGDEELDYADCTGELGIFLYIFQKNTLGKVIGGVSMSCENHATHDCAWVNNNHDSWSMSVASRITDNMENNYNWIDALIRSDDHTENPLIKEGQIYSESENNPKGGDMCDLLILESHGLNRAMALEDHDFIDHDNAINSGMDDTHDFFKTIEGYSSGYIQGKPESDNWDYLNGGSYSDYSEDGFNFETDWILSLVCYQLHGMSPGIAASLDRDSFWLTMLYHGVHILMGFGTKFGGTTAQRNNFADTMVNNWCYSNWLVIEGFQNAVALLPRTINGEVSNRFVIYYHEKNRDDHLYDEGWTGWDYDFENGYEDRDIKCIVDPRGVAP